MKLIGGSTIRDGSVFGAEAASFTVIAGRRLFSAAKDPVRWQDRSRSSSITGVLDTSDSSKPFSTASTIAEMFGRGSSSHSCDFIANAWLRSCMIEEPSP